MTQVQISDALAIIQRGAAEILPEHELVEKLDLGRPLRPGLFQLHWDRIPAVPLGFRPVCAALLGSNPPSAG